MNYNFDTSGEIVNGESTYRAAARILHNEGRLVLNWTDGRGTLYNILLALDPLRYGTLGGMVDGAGTKLWVGIAGRGCFGFGVHHGFCSPEYAAEKLGLTSLVDAEGVATLITGVRMVLAGQQMLSQQEAAE